MQPNTVNTRQDTDPLARAPVPAELLETVARALAAALIPLPRQPPPAGAEEPADFLTAAQFARRLGISRETVRPRARPCRRSRSAIPRSPSGASHMAQGDDPPDLPRHRRRAGGPARAEEDHLAAERHDEHRAEGSSGSSATASTRKNMAGANRPSSRA